MKLIVGNWKMNQTLPQMREFFAGLSQVKIRHEAWIAPQALHLAEALKLSSLPLGAQNCAAEDWGAFTGENSPATLKEMGAHFVILGHSERRALFGETNQLLAKKVPHALSKGLSVIYCVGETLAERDGQRTFDVVKTQLREGLSGVKDPDQHLIVAYEPVWAIGTGKVASPAQAQEVHGFIRNELHEIFGATGNKTRLLYGGSVKPDNVAELLKQKDIDGALVGGASLKSADYLALCQAQI